MKTHNRFDEQHRAICDSCYEAYLDFLEDQAEDAYLDAMAELETAETL